MIAAAATEAAALVGAGVVSAGAAVEGVVVVTDACAGAAGAEGGGDCVPWVGIIKTQNEVSTGRIVKPF